MCRMVIASSVWNKVIHIVCTRVNLFRANGFLSRHRRALLSALCCLALLPFIRRRRPYPELPAITCTTRQECNKFVDIPIYWINGSASDADRERESSMLKELEGLQHIRVEAIKWNTVDSIPDMTIKIREFESGNVVSMREYDEKMESGWFKEKRDYFGCTMSHFTAIGLAMSANHSAALFMEDDTLLNLLPYWDKSPRNSRYGLGDDTVVVWQSPHTHGRHKSNSILRSYKKDKNSKWVCVRGRNGCICIESKGNGDIDEYI